MASQNFIRNEVFDENVDRLKELTRFVITQRKMAEYDATITELDTERTRLRNAVPRNQAAIDVVEERLRDVREEKRQFETATKAEIDSNLEKWRALGEKKEENIITSDFTLNIPEHSLEDWIAKLRSENVKPQVNVHYRSERLFVQKYKHSIVY